MKKLFFLGFSLFSSCAMLAQSLTYYHDPWKMQQYICMESGAMSPNTDGPIAAAIYAVEGDYTKTAASTAHLLYRTQTYLATKLEAEQADTITAKLKDLEEEELVNIAERSVDLAYDTPVGEKSKIDKKKANMSTGIAVLASLNLPHSVTKYYEDAKSTYEFAVAMTHASYEPTSNRQASYIATEARMDDTNREICSAITYHASAQKVQSITKAASPSYSGATKRNAAAIARERRAAWIDMVRNNKPHRTANR